MTRTKIDRRKVKVTEFTARKLTIFKKTDGKMDSSEITAFKAAVKKTTELQVSARKLAVQESLIFKGFTLEFMGKVQVFEIRSHSDIVSPLGEEKGEKSCGDGGL